MKDSLSRASVGQYPDGHGPGPPHRPHGPGDAERADPARRLLDSVPTAKTLSARAVFAEPHSGQSIFASAWLIERLCSNFASHDLQVYS